MRGYWDIEDFLAGEETVSYTNEDVLVKNNFFISEKIKENKKILVPLWLAKALIARDLGNTYAPSYLGHTFRTNFVSEPEILYLSQISYYFYEIGAYFSILNSDAELMDIILVMFTSRIKSLFKSLETVVTEYKSDRLTSIEKRIFESIKKSFVEIQLWKDRKHAKFKFFELKGPLKNSKKIKIDKK